MSAVRSRCVRTLMALAVLCLSACASVGVVQMQPFSTDGCSLFPDRALLGKTDWCGCCVAHDQAYWRGGTSDERLKADQALKACVLAASGDAKLADLMFSGVRMGGGPQWPTPYRWAYGWPPGRMYAPLSEAEQAQADALLSAYQASHPALACPGGP